MHVINHLKSVEFFMLLHSCCHNVQLWLSELSLSFKKVKVVNYLLMN